MELREFTSEQELELAYPVLVLLRPHLTKESCRDIFFASREAGYTLLGMVEEERCVALMGFRILTDFVHGKHLYIDDLVVLPARRSQGIGEKLLEKAEVIARKEGCRGMRLCTGTENTRAITFYECCGWKPKALAFKKSFD